MTPAAILLGAAIAIVFAAANAYLGLRAGMTVSASIPAAVISMAIFRAVGRRGALLENNMVQTIGSSGESVAAGTIFTIPALFMWGLSPSLLQITILAILGGLLGILMMIPLRRQLIVEEHGTLPYPEGTACAEILKAGEIGGVHARTVFSGLGVSAIYKFFTGDCLGLFPATVKHNLPLGRNSMIGMDALPALLGVGYIIGLRISALVFAGGLLGWLVFIPLISLVGEHLTTILPPGSKLISQMSPEEIREYYLRYIGAGAVALGGLLSLAKSVPMLWRSLGGMRRRRAAVAAGQVVRREEHDLSPRVVGIGVAVLILAIALVSPGRSGPLGAVLIAVLIAIFGFFFVAVTSRIVGVIGNSSCPVSGMTIATLLVCTLILRWAGYDVVNGKVAALAIGAIVCIAISNAGDTSQDLKTGFLVGATPSRQQIGLMIGVLSSALFVGLTIFFLHKAYRLGSDQLPAAQATLMSLVIPGVLEGNLPWDLVFIGAGSAAVVELLGIASLPFAIGLYLPIATSTPIMIGGILHWVMVERRSKSTSAMETSDGTLFASGLIAGDALLGVLLAMAIYGGVAFPLLKKAVLGQWATWAAFAILALLLARVDWRGPSKNTSPKS
jgi:putative OPT family oligopeptide transporter